MEWRDKLCSAEEALAVVRPGDHVFVGTGCAAPLTLLHTLEEMPHPPPGVELVHVLLSGALPEKYATGFSRFHHRLLIVGSGDRALVRTGRAYYVPVSLADVPDLMRTGRLPIDAALVQVGPPDSEGMCSLGVSVDATRAAVETASRVVAEVNPNMPLTGRDTLVPVDRFDGLVEVDAPVTEYVHDPVGGIGVQIARYVARIIPDGSTLQIGLGRVANEMLRYLRNRRDLGIHSDVITDAVVDLIDAGVVTGARKSVDPGITTASWALGTRRLYDLIDDDPRFELRPIDQVCKPAVLAAQDRLVSVTQAFAIDLTGQVCADEFGGELYGGVAAQPDFHRGAALSHGGKPIICLASRTDEGKPRIRPRLHANEGVTIPRSDVHYVVTEYGVAYLFGQSLQERAVALMEIAHPDDRDELLDEAKRLNLVAGEQILRSRSAYPTAAETTTVLRDGTSVLLRPTRATDAEHMQTLFYAMTARDVYTRFFVNLASLSDKRAQHLCSVDYQHEMAFVGVIGEDWEREEIIAGTAYYVDPKTRLADVAIMVHPAWQGLGLGTAILGHTADYAREHGLRGFTADILCDNHAMLRTLESLGLQTTKSIVQGAYEVSAFFGT
jgi:acyl-CoA hydrolase/GNAT superfamily N-acetyltransferase